MINKSFLYFFFFLFFFLKEFLILSSFFFVSLEVLLMIFIFPLVYLLIKDTSFNFYSMKNNFTFSFGMSLILFLLMFCFCSGSPLLFLFFLESCVIFMILLILNFSKDFDKISSTVFMFLINIFPSILFMNFCKEWGYSEFVSNFLLGESLSLFSFLCFLGLLLSKLPLFLLHFWLTKAHVSASGCGSMVLASLMLKIGTMGLYKFYYFFSFTYKKFMSVSFFFVVWSMSILLLIMIRFFDMKYLVACSSIVHMSPISCVVLHGNPCEINGSVLMMVGHGLISYLIFYIVTVIYEMSYHRSVDFNKSLGSINKVLLMFFFFFFLFNMSFPPFCSFISELYFIYSFFLFDSYPLIFFLGSLVLSGVFFFFVLSKSLFGKKNLMENSMGFFLNSFYCYYYLFIFVFIPYFFI